MVYCAHVTLKRETHKRLKYKEKNQSALGGGGAVTDKATSIGLVIAAEFNGESVNQV